MAPSNLDWRKMDPWEGPHKLPESIRRCLSLAIFTGVLAWCMCGLHLTVLGVTWSDYNPVAFTFLNSAASSRSKEASVSAFMAMFTTYSRVAITLDVIQMCMRFATLGLPILFLAFTVHRKLVMIGTVSVRLLTLTDLIACVLRLTSISQEGGALVDACIQAQTQSSVIKGGPGISMETVTEAAATAACTRSLAWFTPISVIASIIDIGVMLLFCWNVLTYERELMTERYPSETPRGLLSWTGSSNRRRTGRGGAYMPISTVSQDDEKRD
ncbi:hypothetical protein OC846_003766 [Tilletia horrida]|uniref:Uncharacterized protein n=1 Tax=Tilletia horrida TaxID=155126 RepID=A0AAN6GRW5_9BASI|nr:hypothetical protein OC845_005255 [Tilletia horrida]KAK0550216.1 hypothetical protein OC846_003766 [Tilletia horrida]KAK0565012.1 hypothetical protein OC861_003997 [Tilletia horrida]